MTVKCKQNGSYALVNKPVTNLSFMKDKMFAKYGSVFGVECI